MQPPKRQSKIYLYICLVAVVLTIFYVILAAMGTLSELIEVTNSGLVARIAILAPLALLFGAAISGLAHRASRQRAQGNVAPKPSSIIGATLLWIVLAALIAPPLTIAILFLFVL